MQYVVYDYVENGNSVAYDAHVSSTKKEAEIALPKAYSRHTQIEVFKDDEQVAVTCQAFYWKGELPKP